MFRSYLASLQDGSIVVFDSLDSTAKPPLNVSVLDIFQSIMYEVGRCRCNCRCRCRGLVRVILCPEFPPLPTPFHTLLNKSSRIPSYISFLNTPSSLKYLTLKVCADAASRLCLVLVLTQAAGDSTLTPAEPADEASPDYLANISGTGTSYNPSLIHHHHTLTTTPSLLVTTITLVMTGIVINRVTL